MPDSRKILVVGAGPNQVPLIETAQDQEYEVWAVSYLDDDPGLGVADHGYQISILDVDRLERLCRAKGIKTVVTGASDLGCLTVGHLNEVLGLHGITEKQARNLTDKSRFVALQETLNLPRPQSLCVKSRGDLEHALQELRTYPLVLKPLFASGSRGVHIVQSADQARECHESVVARSAIQKGYVIQTYLDGIEHGGECLIEDGRVVFLELTHKFHNEYRVPVGHFVPFHLSPAVKECLTDQLNSIVTHLDVRNSAMNIDVIVTPDDVPVLIDASFRLGGNLLPQLMSLKFGVNTFERVIEYASGQLTQPTVAEARPGCFGSIVFGSSTPDILTEPVMRNISDALQHASHIESLVFDIDAGTNYKCFDESAHRFGHGLFRVDDLGTYNRLLKSIHAIVHRMPMSGVVQTPGDPSGNSE
jgi:biotin carboxylase